MGKTKEVTRETVRERVRDLRTDRVCLRVPKQDALVLEQCDEKDNVESKVTPKKRREETGRVKWSPILTGISKRSPRRCLVESHMTLVLFMLRENRLDFSHKSRSQIQEDCLDKSDEQLEAELEP